MIGEKASKWFSGKGQQVSDSFFIAKFYFPSSSFSGIIYYWIITRRIELYGRIGVNPCFHSLFLYLLVFPEQNETHACAGYPLRLIVFKGTYFAKHRLLFSPVCIIILQSNKEKIATRQTY